MSRLTFTERHRVRRELIGALYNIELQIATTNCPYSQTNFARTSPTRMPGGNLLVRSLGIPIRSAPRRSCSLWRLCPVASPRHLGTCKPILRHQYLPPSAARYLIGVVDHIFDSRVGKPPCHDSCVNLGSIGEFFLQTTHFFTGFYLTTR